LKNQCCILSFSKHRDEEWGEVVWDGWHYSHLGTLVGSRDGFDNWVVLSESGRNFPLLPCSDDPLHLLQLRVENREVSLILQHLEAQLSSCLYLTVPGWICCVPSLFPTSCLWPCWTQGTGTGASLIHLSKASHLLANFHPKFLNGLYPYQFTDFFRLAERQRDIPHRQKPQHGGVRALADPGVLFIPSNLQAFCTFQETATSKGRGKDISTTSALDLAGYGKSWGEMLILVCAPSTGKSTPWPPHCDLSHSPKIHIFSLAHAPRRSPSELTRGDLHT